jgi:hypothetical protein
MKTYELRGDCHTEDWRLNWADTSPGCAGLSPPKENEIHFIPLTMINPPHQKRAEI